MPLATRNPTSNTTPDPGQGGLAVTGNTNTGHGSTTASGGGGSSQTKTCLWTGFLAAGGQPLTVTLKIDHTSDGSLSGLGASNDFVLEYSLNGGGVWNTAVARGNFGSLQNATFSVALPVTQDLTQVRVRDFIDAVTVDIGESASATVSVSNIKIEIQLADGAVGCMM